jgi:hypothetical protein
MQFNSWINAVDSVIWLNPSWLKISLLLAVLNMVRLLLLLLLCYCHHLLFYLGSTDFIYVKFVGFNLKVLHCCHVFNC